MGDSEYGQCMYCQKIGNVQRAYYHYDVECGCCGDKHFEYIKHCDDCIPRPPVKISAYVVSIEERKGNEIIDEMKKQQEN